MIYLQQPVNNSPLELRISELETEFEEGIATGKVFEEMKQIWMEIRISKSLLSGQNSSQDVAVRI